MARTPSLLPVLTSGRARPVRAVLSVAGVPWRRAKPASASGWRAPTSASRSAASCCRAARAASRSCSSSSSSSAAPCVIVLAWVVLEAIGWLWIASTTSPRARTSSYAAPSARRGKSRACIQHVGMDSDRDFSAAPERSRAAGAVPRVGRRRRQEYSRAAHTGNQKRVSERVCQPYLMARGSCHGERL